MYVKQNGDVYPCCQSYMLDGAPVGNIGTTAAEDLEFGRDAAHAPRCMRQAGQARSTSARAAAPRFRIRALVAGSLLLHGRTVRRLLPWMERLVYFSKLPRSLLTPPKKATTESELVQIGGRPVAGSLLLEYESEIQVALRRSDMHGVGHCFASIAEGYFVLDEDVHALYRGFGIDL